MVGRDEHVGLIQTVERQLELPAYCLTIESYSRPDRCLINDWLFRISHDAMRGSPHDTPPLLTLGPMVAQPVCWFQTDGVRLDPQAAPQQRTRQPLAQFVHGVS